MRSVSKNVVLLGATCLFCAYLFEFLLGYYIVKSLPRYPLPPHAVQRHQAADYDVHYGYNNLSLRGGDVDLQSRYDVVLLGDSFFFGQGVGDGKTLAGILEQGGRKVLNASEIATNPMEYFHKLRVLQAEGLRAEQVVVGLCMGNDFQDIADRDIASALAYPYRSGFLRYGPGSFLTLSRLRYQVRKKGIGLGDAWRRLLGRGTGETVVVHEFEHRKRFYEDWLQFFTDNRPEMMRAMREGGGETLNGRIGEADYFRMAQFSDASLARTTLLLNTLSRLSRPTPVSVVLIPGPHYVLVFRSPRYDRFVERLQAGLDEGVRVLDLHGAVTPAMHFPRDGHWNEDGHRFVAGLLVRNVLSPPEEPGNAPSFPGQRPFPSKGAGTGRGSGAASGP